MVWIKSPSMHQQQLMSKNGKVLLVIAHPDDEVMFFTPVLLTFAASAHQISILCLSNGNFEGLGNIRSNELVKSAAMFQIPARHVYVINDPELEDGMQNIWPAKRISDIVSKHIQSTGASLVITFDERGVSDHPNHIATYHGVRLALSELSKQSPNPPLGLKLKSLHILRKFCGVLELLCACVFADYVVAAFGLLTALRGMYVHRSQNLLYRQVFVVISAFTYVNSFAPIT